MAKDYTKDNLNTGALFQTSKETLEGPFTTTSNQKGSVLAVKADNDIEVTILDEHGGIIAEGMMKHYINEKPGSPLYKGFGYVLFLVTQDSGRRFFQIKPDTAGERLDLDETWFS